jgi:hypothetical protein
MRFLTILGVGALLVAGCGSSKGPGSQTITATQDTDGALHPAQVQLARSARVKCLSAEGSNASPAKCNVNGASTSPNETVVATDKVYLLCEGTAPLKCSAKVDQ